MDSLTFEMDSKRLVREFGGQTRLSRELREQVGVRITDNAISRWISRKRIPSNHLAAIALLAVKKKQRFNLEEYVITL